VYFLVPGEDRTRLGSQMVEYSECLKSWISIPIGKDRPLLAGRGRVPEVGRILVDDSMAVDNTNELEEVELEEVS
jgi:hypothetical protein